MCELSRDVIRTAQQLTVYHYAHAHAVRNANVDEILRPRWFAPFHPKMCERAGTAGVFDFHRQPGGGGQLLPELDPSPAQRRRIQNSSAALIHHARNSNADSLNAGAY